MTVPTVATYSVAAKVAAQTSFRDLLDSGSGPGLIKVRNSSDTLLGTLTMSDPSGSVNGGTGLLTLSAVTADSSADAGGTIAYVELCDSDGDVHLALPAQQGTSPVSGKAVFNTLTVVLGGPINMLSVTIG